MTVKSTLIGRLLYDTQSLTTDKLEAIEKKARAKGYDYLDFSLATDGLVAEEQGITIDVAHIIFRQKKLSLLIPWSRRVYATWLQFDLASVNHFN
jgi:sulfate adenylyltransferase subunit 1